MDIPNVALVIVALICGCSLLIYIIRQYIALAIIIWCKELTDEQTNAITSMMSSAISIKFKSSNKIS